MTYSFPSAFRTNAYKYAIRNIVEQAKKVEDKGTKIHYLNIGDPARYGFVPPQEIVASYIEALQNKTAMYAPSSGLLESRIAISQKLSSKKIHINEDDIFITDGASEAADLVYTSILNPGDEVLVPLPGYPLYNALAHKVEAKEVFYTQMQDDYWNINIDAIRQKITSKTKMIVVVNPNNPTGKVFDKNTLQQILTIAKEHKLVVLADEVYSELVFDQSFVPIASLADNETAVISLDSLSKNFLVPGWRIGWLSISNIHLLQPVKKAIMKLADARLCANTPAQYVIPTAMNLPQEYFAPYLKRLLEQRNLTYEMINDIPGIVCNKPEGAFYAFPKADLPTFGFATDEEFVLDLVDKTGILFVHGSGFGMPASEGFFRVVFLPHANELKKLYSIFKEYAVATRKKAPSYS